MNVKSFIWMELSLTLAPIIKISRFLPSFPRTVFFFKNYFLASLGGIWDPSSPIRDWTCAPYSERAVLTAGSEGKSYQEQNFKCDYINSLLCSIFCLCLGIRHQMSKDIAVEYKVQVFISQCLMKKVTKKKVSEN